VVTSRGKGKSVGEYVRKGNSGPEEKQKKRQKGKRRKESFFQARPQEKEKCYQKKKHPGNHVTTRKNPLYRTKVVSIVNDTGCS